MESIKLYQLKTDLDCSNLENSKQLIFSDFNDAPSWKLLKDGTYIITIQESDACEEY